MNILSVNTERKLIDLASSIGRNPSSWRGWMALYVSLSGLDDDTLQDCLLWTKSIVQCYLQDVQGQVYFCDDKGIHIVCQSNDHDILHEAGTQICELIHAESAVQVSYGVYKLDDENSGYAEAIMDNEGDVFSLFVSKHTNWGADLEHSLFTESKPKKNIVTTPKVLLVEDDPVTRWMVRNAVKNECDLATAPCANKVFSLYSSYQPDIVFLDIDLPDHNGRDVLKWIVSNDPGAYVIMFSSNNTLENMTETMENGASGFIGKPFLKTQLLEYIHGYAS